MKGAQQAYALVALLVYWLTLHNANADGSTTWRAKDFPNPARDLKACGREGVTAEVSRICDPDGLLSRKSANVVEGIIQEIEAGREPYNLMRCAGKGKTGFKVAVALLRHMHIPAGGAPEDAARKFAKQLHDDWGVGDKECNNGVLMLLAVGDRQVYISTGAGAKEALPDSKVRGILAKMRPHLRAAAYDAAVEQATIDIGLGLAGADFDDDDEGSGWFDPVLLGILGIVGGCFGVNMYKNRQRRKKFGECKKLLDKLKREQQHALRTNTYNTTSCPICLEDFTTSGSLAVGSKVSGSGSKAGSGSGGSSRADADAPSAPLLKQGNGGSRAVLATGNAAASERWPLSLPCGHRFCEPCISQWVDSGSNTTCPVCRKSISDADAGPPPVQTLPSAPQNQQQAAMAIYNDLFVSDMMFRLAVLQNRYPTYIDSTTADRWGQHIRQGTLPSFEEIRYSQMHDAGAHHAHQSMGSHGASSSFGGGTSFGGGGGGSSW